MTAQIDPNTWQITAPQNGRRRETCLISSQNKPIEINLGLGEPMGCPWGASIFEEDSTQSRVNLDLTLLDEEATATLGDLDEWLIQYACKNKETLFKDAKTDRQIRETYRRLVREKDSFAERK